jgi:hypothetical protein
MNSRVYGLGDMYAPKHATLSQAQRYQNIQNMRRRIYARIDSVLS